MLGSGGAAEVDEGDVELDLEANARYVCVYW